MRESMSELDQARKAAGRATQAKSTAGAPPATSSGEQGKEKKRKSEHIRPLEERRTEAALEEMEAGNWEKVVKRLEGALSVKDVPAFVPALLLLRALREAKPKKFAAISIDEDEELEKRTRAQKERAREFREKLESQEANGSRLFLISQLHEQEGRKTKRPKQEAIEACRRAAEEHGMAVAQFELSRMLLRGGGGGGGDEARVEILVQRAAEQGHATAQQEHGERLVRRGKTAEGERMIRTAAREGVGNAHESVGMMEMERGNLEEAAAEFRQAAEQGVVGSHYHLGVLHQTGGGGVRQDAEEAIRHFRIEARTEANRVDETNRRFVEEARKLVEELEKQRRQPK